MSDDRSIQKPERNSIWPSFVLRFFHSKDVKQKIICLATGSICLFCLLLILFSDRLFCFKITVTGDVHSADYAAVEYTDFQSSKGIYISPDYDLCKIWIPVSGIQKAPMLSFYCGRKLTAENISISFLRFRIKDLDQNEVCTFLKNCSLDNETTRYPLEPVLGPHVPVWCNSLLFLRPHVSALLIVVLFLVLMRLCLYDSWSVLLKKFLYPQKASSCTVFNYVIRFCSALYFVLVFLLSSYRIGYLNLTWSLLPAFFLLFWGMLNLLDALLPDDLTLPKAEHNRCRLWGLCTGIFTFLILLGLFMGCGGNIANDPLTQIISFHDGFYNDWHPFLHTLFLVGCLKIYNHFSCIVFVQIILFSGAFGYFVSKLFQIGLPKRILIPVCLFLILNPHTLIVA